MTNLLPTELNQLEQLVLQKLPILVEISPQIQKLVTDLAEHRKETTDKFYQLLGELRRDREEQTRKWEEHKREQQLYREEQNRKWEEHKREQQLYREEQKQEQQLYREEQNRKWEEQNGKWEEQNREWKEVHEEIKAIALKQERSIGALGARWGMQSEASFRNALAAILEKSFDVKVLNVNEYDDEGIVFGRPDQVELDVIIKNGLLIICEIKSSIDKAGMYIFERKVRFYEKRHQRPVSRMIVISPMVDLRARPVAERLGIEVYSDSMDVKPE
ncbi:MAG: hypothetical protein BWK79_08020 [Beggiatoa sp. IS2]|nr:MAG: hypothetical protein BWK79_08020 [Beggiatoa sp. IS2]